MRCCGYQHQRPCSRPPERIVFAADGLPRLGCPSHSQEGGREWNAAGVTPAGLPAALLRQWQQKERHRQRLLRAEILRLTALLEVSERRELEIRAELAGQPALALE